MEDGRKNVYIFTKIGEMKTRDLKSAKTVKCIKDENQRMLLVKEKEIKKRYKRYFDKFFNESHTRNWSKLNNSIDDRCQMKKLFKDWGGSD